MDVLVGSDVGVLNIFPGYSTHDEMALFVSELGMTPAEVIERATRRSARFLRISDSVGTVERGKVADLVLLEADPLEDIRNTPVSPSPRPPFTCDDTSRMESCWQAQLLR